MFRIILLSFATLLTAFLLRAIPWAVHTFPLTNAEAVLFTVFSQVGGAGKFVIETLKDDVLKSGLALFGTVTAAELAGAAIIARARAKAGGSAEKPRFRDRFLATCVRVQAVALCALIVCGGVSFYRSGIPFAKYAKFIAGELQKPSDSELYRKHYTFPDSVQITFPEQKQNLIVILMESMESNFQDKAHGGDLQKSGIPEFSRLAERNLSFTPGGVSVAGTGWTIAALVAKTCGVPLNIPLKRNEDSIATFLPGAKCLTDILKSEGYTTRFLEGSYGEFSSTREFLRAHGNPELHDVPYYKGKGLLPQKYFVFWGMEDHRLYGFAKRELGDTAFTGKPFAMFISTIDTHEPYGYRCDICPRGPRDKKKQYPTVLRCASHQLNDFLAWAKAQPWYANTTIAVMGDHTVDGLSPAAGIPDGAKLRWADLFVNSAQTTQNTRREFSSFDMYPTLLESMGVRIDGRALGLGVSLFSDRPTLLDIYPQKKLDSLLRQKNFQYNYFLYGDSAKARLMNLF